MKITEPLRCPFCLSMNVRVIEKSTCVYSVKCFDCKSYGPEMLSAPRAIKYWNIVERKDK